MAGFDPWTIGLSVLGGLFSSRSSSRAATAQTQADQQALALQERMFNQMRQDYQPWMQAGVPALNAMMQMVGLQPTAGVPSLQQTVGGGMGGSPAVGGGTGSLVPGSLSAALLTPAQGGLNAPGSLMPGVPTGYMMGQGDPSMSELTALEYLRGQRPSNQTGAYHLAPNLPALNVNSPLTGNTFAPAMAGVGSATPLAGINPITGLHQAISGGGDPYAWMSQSLSGEAQSPLSRAFTPDAPLTLADALTGPNLMGTRQLSPYGTPVSGLGGYRSPKGWVTGTIKPDDLPGDASVGFMTPAMEAAAQAWRDQADITPRFTGGPMMPGGKYTVGELEPELITTQSGEQQFVTQPTLMSPTEPSYVTPGPIGASMSPAAQLDAGMYDPYSSLYGTPSYTTPLAQSIQPTASPVANTAPYSPTYAPDTGITPMPMPINNVDPMEGTTNFPKTVATAAPMSDLPPGAIAPTYQGMSDDPGYMFRFGEGQRALERSAAARGGLLSGGTARRLTRFGQEMGSQEFMNRFNRLASIAGMGQVMTQGMGQLGYGFGGQMGNIMSNIGTGRASGYLGQGSALGGSLQNLAFLRAFGGG